LRKRPVARAGRGHVAETVGDEEQVSPLEDELVDSGRLGLPRGIGVAEQLLGRDEGAVEVGVARYPA